jgi:hypothetical protein
MLEKPGGCPDMRYSRSPKMFSVPRANSSINRQTSSRDTLLFLENPPPAECWSVTSYEWVPSVPFLKSISTERRISVGMKTSFALFFSEEKYTPDARFPQQQEQ